MAEVGNLNISLGLDSVKFQEGIARAKKAMSEFEKSVKPTVRAFENFGSGLKKTGESLTKNLTLPIIAAGVAIGAAVNKMSVYGSTINDMSVRTGFSRESLQELKFAADQTGVSMESIEKSSRKLTKSIGEAATGTGNSSELFEKLGISIKNADGSLRPVNEVFNETIGALSQITDETTRNVISMDLFGKSANELNPLIEAGTEGLADFAKQARDAGLVMNDKAIIAADDFGDKMDKLKSQIAHSAMELAQGFMPVIEKIISFISSTVIPKLKEFAEWFKNLSEGQKEFIIKIAASLAVLGPLAVVVGKISGGIGGLIKNVSKLAGALSSVGAVTGVIIGAIVLLGVTIKQAVDFSGGWANLWDDMKNDMKNFVDYVKGAMKIIGGVLSGNFANIQKGVDEFEKAFQQGVKNRISGFARAGQAVKEQSSLENELAQETKKAEEALKKLVGKDLIINLTKADKKTKELKESFTDLSFLAAKIGGGFSPDAGLLLRAKIEFDFSQAKPQLLKFTNDFKQKIENQPAPLLPAPNDSLIKKGLTNIQLAFAMSKDTATRNAEEIAAAWERMVEKIKTKVNEMSQAMQSVMSGITGIFSESMLNQEIMLDNRYGKERMLIENSKMSEEQKTEALKALGEKEAKDRKELMVKKAKMDKAGALFGAVIAGAQAIVAALALGPPAGIILAVIVGALAAAQIALIASRPIPAFAEGGMVFGETMALVGEGKNTSRANPEIIAPLDKLMNFIMPESSASGGQYEFIISGENLRTVLSRNEKSRKFLSL